MPDQHTRWIGLKEANRALRKLPAFVKVDAQQEMDTTGFRVRQIAATLAPRDTGFLADTALKWESRPRSIAAVVGVIAEGFYWKFLEYGTRKMSARPFLRPAADRMRADHHRRLVKALEKAANDVEAAQ